MIISNQERFEELKEKFKKDGVGKLHVLADFDQTLTHAFVNNKRTPALISILADEGYLTSDYPEKANALFKKYHDIEIDPDIPFKEKRKAMEEWWTKHFDLLISSGLDRNDIEEIVKSENIALRKGISELLNNLQSNNIPLVILSSSGVGKESIVSYLGHKKLLSDNIYIICNSFNWSEDGKAISVNQPIIHSLNKNETVIKDFPEVFEKIEERTNVILLGNSIHDIDMITGFDYDNLIKIGFLNEEVDKNLEKYKENFDVIITDDSSAELVNSLLKELI